MRLGIKTADFQPVGSSTTCPPGSFTGKISRTEVKQTKRGDGSQLLLHYNTQSGHAVSSRHNVNNPNAMAVEIAIRELAQIGRAVGLAFIEDTDQLVGAILDFDVSVSFSDQGKPFNDVGNWRAVGTGAPNRIDAMPTAPAAHAPSNDWGAPQAPAQAWGQPQQAPAAAPAPWGQQQAAPVAQAPTQAWGAQPAVVQAPSMQQAPQPAPQQAAWGAPQAPVPQQAPQVDPSAPKAPWG